MILTRKHGKANTPDEVLKAALVVIASEFEARNCLDCFHFDEKTEVCEKFKQRPPARIIALGCDHHDNIPF